MTKRLLVYLFVIALFRLLLQYIDPEMSIYIRGLIFIGVSIPMLWWVIFKEEKSDSK